MNLKVKRGFRDKEARRDRFPGQEFKASADRGKILMDLHLVEEVTEADKKEDSGAASRTTKENKVPKNFK
jgi:hypothetical protein